MTELTQEAKALLSALDKKHLENIEAIQRVRELANHWLNGQSNDIPYDSDQFAKALLESLDGENNG